MLQNDFKYNKYKFNYFKIILKENVLIGTNRNQPPTKA